MIEANTPVCDQTSLQLESKTIIPSVYQPNEKNVFEIGAPRKLDEKYAILRVYMNLHS